MSVRGPLPLAEHCSWLAVLRVCRRVAANLEVGAWAAGGEFKPAVPRASSTQLGQVWHLVVASSRHRSRTTAALIAVARRAAANLEVGAWAAGGEFKAAVPRTSSTEVGQVWHLVIANSRHRSRTTAALIAIARRAAANLEVGAWAAGGEFKTAVPQASSTELGQVWHLVIANSWHRSRTTAALIAVLCAGPPRNLEVGAWAAGGEFKTAVPQASSTEVG